MFIKTSYFNGALLTKNSGGLKLCLAAMLLGFASQSYAHIEYFDLNQGEQVGDLTDAGKALSTTQYGVNPPVAGLPSLNSTSDRALNNTAYWNASNQNYLFGSGSFANSQTSTAAGYTGATFYTANTVSVHDVTDFGWGNGTLSTLGDTHKVDFFNFRLTQTSDVTISFNVNDGAGNYIANAFSLYQGVASYQAHDDALDPLNPKGGFPPLKIQDPLDSLTAPADAQGIASAYRNTLTNSAAYVGQFDALHNWGDSNAAGNWSNVKFLTAADSALAKTSGTGGFSTNANDTLETLVITLTAGDYTIAASGALNSALAGVDSYGLTNLNGTLTYNAVAAIATPLPASSWLFISALLGLFGTAKRKTKS